MKYIIRFFCDDNFEILDEHDLTPLSQVLLHHGHVESIISEKNPLLGVIIYDSCRDDPKEFIKKKLEASQQLIKFSFFSLPVTKQPSCHANTWMNEIDQAQDGKEETLI